jgi:hypothetical protein
MLTCCSNVYASGNMSWQYIDGKLMYTRILPKLVNKAPKKEIENIRWKFENNRVVSEDKTSNLSKKNQKKLHIHTPIQSVNDTKKMRFSNVTNSNENKLYEEEYYRIPSFEEQKEKREVILRKMSNSHKKTIKNIKKEPENDKEKQKKYEMVSQLTTRDEMIKKLTFLHAKLIKEKAQIISSRIKKKKDIEKYEDLRLKFIELKKVYDEEYGN